MTPLPLWRRNFYVLSAASFLVAMGFTFNLPLLPLLVSSLVGGDVALAAAWSGMAFGVNPLVAAVAGPLWGRFGDRYGHGKTVLIALLAMGALMGLFAFVEDAAQVVALRAAIGCLGAFTPAVMAAIAAGSPREHTARALGVLQALQVLGAVVGPLAAGILASSLGLRAPYLVVAGLLRAGLPAGGAVLP